MRTMSSHFIRAAALMAAVGSADLPAMAESKVGSTIESRVLLGFKVNDAALGSMLPEGWLPVTLPQGPVGGSNLIVALIDRHLILDADGAPEEISSGPTVALLTYARKEGVEGIRGFVTRVFEEDELVDPYLNSVQADIDRKAAYFDAGGSVRKQSEHWTVHVEGGGEIDIRLEFSVRALRWSKGGESRPYSSVSPDFHRIYRYDQLAGLAMNELMGIELQGKASFVSTDPAIATIFDGSEALAAVVTIPTYLREISLP